MNADELLSDTFAAHEFLAPDPTSLLRELPERRRHRLRVRMAVGGAIVAVAAIAAGAIVVSHTDTQQHGPVSAAGPSTSGGYTFTRPTVTGSVIPKADRQRASDFSGALLNGGTYSLSQQRGKVVVVNFWATWCGPCTTETPQFDSIYRQYKAKGVTFVGIDTDEETYVRIDPKDETSRAKAFVADNNISYPIVFDQQGKTAVTLGKIPANLPFTVLVDQQGRVAAVYMGAVAPTNLTRAITVLLAEK